ncbi:MAG: hypothetical protein ACUZ8O_00510 [Candidatus Anammoxibacter sp.]
MLYTKKAQVLFTEDQYNTLQEIASKSHKKIGALIREAVDKIYIEKRRKSEIAKAVDHLLSLPPTPAPDSYHKWEKRYSESKQSSN